MASQLWITTFYLAVFLPGFAQCGLSLIQVRCERALVKVDSAYLQQSPQPVDTLGASRTVNWSIVSNSEEGTSIAICCRCPWESAFCLRWGFLTLSVITASFSSVGSSFEPMGFVSTLLLLAASANASFVGASRMGEQREVKKSPRLLHPTDSWKT